MSSGHGEYVKQKTILLWVVGFSAAFTADTLSKVWAEQALELGQHISILGDVFQITLGYNTGVAFGMFANTGSITLILTGIVIAGLSIWMLRAFRAKELPQASGFALGLILGGAFGNFADRFTDGRVTDFLDVGIGTLRWPTFNLADSFVVVGIVLLLVLVVGQKDASRRDLVRDTE